MPEKKPKTTFALMVTRTIPAPPSEVFRAWTNSKEMKAWFAPGNMSVPIAESDPRVGGKYRVAMREKSGDTYAAHGVYIVVDPPRRLVFSWSWKGQKSEKSPRLVTVEFKARGKSTEATLTHQLLESRADAEEHSKGWQGCLENLADHLHA